MSDTVLVKPARGLILAGIPSSGAEIPADLAETWIADQLVVRVEPEKPAPPEKKPATVRRSPKGSGSTRPAKQRRTR
jgi:hypothetical protein